MFGHRTFNIWLSNINSGPGYLFHSMLFHSMPCHCCCAISGESILLHLFFATIKQQKTSFSLNGFHVCLCIGTCQDICIGTCQDICVGTCQDIPKHLCFISYHGHTWPAMPFVTCVHVALQETHTMSVDARQRPICERQGEAAQQGG